MALGPLPLRRRRNVSVSIAVSSFPTRAITTHRCTAEGFKLKPTNPPVHLAVPVEALCCSVAWSTSAAPSLRGRQPDDAPWQSWGFFAGRKETPRAGESIPRKNFTHQRTSRTGTPFTRDRVRPELTPSPPQKKIK